MSSICTGTEESSQRSWCCLIDILSNNPLELRLRQRFTILQKFRSKELRFEVVKEQFERVEVLAFGGKNLIVTSRVLNMACASGL